MIIYHCLRNVSRAIQRGTQAQDHSPQPTAASDSMLHLHPSSALKKISKKLSGEVGTLLIYTSGGGGRCRSGGHPGHRKTGRANETYRYLGTKRPYRTQMKVKAPTITARRRQRRPLETYHIPRINTLSTKDVKTLTLCNKNTHHTPKINTTPP